MQRIRKMSCCNLQYWLSTVGYATVLCFSYVTPKHMCAFYKWSLVTVGTQPNFLQSGILKLHCSFLILL